MPGFVIKELPEALHRKLKAQAARHHRSIANEVLAVLEQALGTQGTPAKASAPFRGRIELTDALLDKARRKDQEPA